MAAGVDGSQENPSEDAAAAENNSTVAGLNVTLVCNGNVFKRARARPDIKEW